MVVERGNSPDIENWLRLARINGVGPVRFKRLLERFGSVDNILGASVARLAAVDGIGEKTARLIANGCDENEVRRELELAERLGVWVIHLEDARYPVQLKRIYDPPLVLYVKGTLKREDNLAVAIVGSRRCSAYGREQASRFGHMLACAGFTIVSGMARGIDTAGHCGALSGGGRTIAVQGSGLAKIFPPENKKLAELICESGACISELPLNCEPCAENFPPRNRIIAGLSVATIVVEASNRSGALITAGMAAEYGREVMAVPGKVDSPLSRGTHKLIKEGAKLVESIEDVMDALGFIGEQLREYAIEAEREEEEGIRKKRVDVEGYKIQLSERERSVYEVLDDEPMHIEQIISAVGRSAAEVHSILVCLQLKGLIRQLAGGFYQRR